ncbi:hypothetical protein [Paraburkholderia hospita]|uniref:hypothetical protein n=1 Tax=Paraburkholderia hospita TaxID=169430 RepID=UPI001EE66629|nr:hypothetical protein [Paraburkholderia hospita]
MVAMTVDVLRRVPAGGRRQAAGGRRQAAGMDTKEFDEVFSEIVVNPLRDEGFRTADVPRSEIIANPNDTKDYLHGMWSLPAKAVTSKDYALPRPDRQQSLAYGCG